MVRRMIAEKAKAFFKELNHVNLNGVVGATHAKQKILDEQYEKMIDETLGWKKGECYSDFNIRITFNTFLRPDDSRLDSPNSPGPKNKEKPKEKIEEAKEEE